MAEREWVDMTFREVPVGSVWQTRKGRHVVVVATDCSRRDSTRQVVRVRYSGTGILRPWWRAEFKKQFERVDVPEHFDGGRTLSELPHDAEQK